MSRSGELARHSRRSCIKSVTRRCSSSRGVTNSPPVFSRSPRAAPRSSSCRTRRSCKAARRTFCRSAACRPWVHWSCARRRLDRIYRSPRDANTTGLRTPTSSSIARLSLRAMGCATETSCSHVRPVVDARPDPVRSAVVLFDTSASRALDLDLQAGQLIALAAEIAEQSADAILSVACFDQQISEIYSGPARAFGEAEAEKVRARGALGGSNIAGALAWARERARAMGAKRVILVSDGVATVGKVDRAGLAGAVREMSAFGVERLDAVAVGGIRDDGALSSLARAGLARDGVVAGGRRRPAGRSPARVGHAFRSRRERRRSTVGVPEQDQWRAAGRRVPRLCGGALPDNLSPSPSAVRLRRCQTFSRRNAHSSSARGRRQRSRACSTAKERTATPTRSRSGSGSPSSTSHRVMSPYTALLVLESEGDYERFGVDRNALSDILQVEGSRVALTHRADAVTPSNGTPKRERPGEVAQFGIIGLLHLIRTPPARRGNTTRKARLPATCGGRLLATRSVRGASVSRESAREEAAAVRESVWGAPVPSGTVPAEAARPGRPRPSCVRRRRR